MSIMSPFDPNYQQERKDFLSYGLRGKDAEDFLLAWGEIKNSRIMCGILFFGLIGCELQQKKVCKVFDIGFNNCTTYFKKFERAKIIKSLRSVHKIRNPQEIDKRHKIYVVDYSGRGMRYLFKETFEHRAHNIVDNKTIAPGIDRLFDFPETAEILKIAYCCPSETVDYAKKTYDLIYDSGLETDQWAAFWRNTKTYDLLLSGPQTFYYALMTHIWFKDSERRLSKLEKNHKGFILALRTLTKVVHGDMESTPNVDEFFERIIETLK